MMENGGNGGTGENCENDGIPPFWGTPDSPLGFSTRNCEKVRNGEKLHPNPGSAGSATI